MKILLNIDSLGSGGAQTQITHLACGLKERGHDVEMFIYYGKYNFHRPKLHAAGITINEINNKARGFSISVLVTLTRLIRRKHYDAVVSFLKSPNITG